MVIDDTMPSIVGFLDKNIRISVDKTPIVDADVGVNASIRIVNQQTVSEEKLLNSGSATAEMLHFLTACIRYGVSVASGSTGPLQDHDHGLAAVQCAQVPAPYYH